MPPAYSSLTPAEATLAIDALDGMPWHTSQYATPRVQAAAASGHAAPRRLLDDFWNWLKGAVATVTHVIVCVAEDIYAGIRFIVNGVAHVFQAIITGIEQIASAIGAFFIELGQLIEEIIEALSVLFQFGHIIDTHTILKTELLKRINGVQHSAYPGLVALVGSQPRGPRATGAIAQVDTFFNEGEQTINDNFNSLANALSGTPSSSLPGRWLDRPLRIHRHAEGRRRLVQQLHPGHLGACRSSRVGSARVAGRRWRWPSRPREGCRARTTRPP